MMLSLVSTYCVPGTEPTGAHMKKPRKIKVNGRRETAEKWLDAEAQLGKGLVLPSRVTGEGAHSSPGRAHLQAAVHRAFWFHSPGEHLDNHLRN